MARPSLLRTTTLLTGAHLGGVLLSFLEIPILARGLGAHAYGQLVWLQAVGLMAALGIEYGFNMSALRQLAVAAPAERPATAARLWASVTLAKGVLSAAVLPMVVLALWWGAHTPPSLWWASLLFALSFGFSPFWLLQGLDRVGSAVALDTGARMLGLLLLWVFIDSPQDLALAIWIMAGASGCATLLTMGLAWRLAGRGAWQWAPALQEIRSGWHVFVYRSAGNLMLSSTVAVLGAVAGPAAVAVYAPAEKLFKGVVGLTGPLMTALLPHLSQQFAQGRGAPAARQLLLGLGAAGTLAALLLSLLGPQLLTLLLGPSFANASGLLTAMAWLIPLRLLTQGLGTGMLIPAGQDRAASLTLIACSLLGLALGALLAHWLAAPGMLAGVMLAEVVLLACLLGHARGHQLLVWRRP